MAAPEPTGVVGRPALRGALRAGVSSARLCSERASPLQPDDKAIRW